MTVRIEESTFHIESGETHTGAAGDALRLLMRL